MKNNNYLFSVLFFLCFLFTSSNAFGQSHIIGKGFFVDADLTILPFIYGFGTGQISCTSGYRFNKKIAAGLEYRGAGYTTDGGRSQTMNGVGLVLRITDKHFIAKVTQGFVLSAKHVDDSPYYDTYNGGAFYNSITLGCRLRSGLYLGGTFTLARNVKHTRTYYEEDNLDNIPPEDINYRLRFFGITVGVTFPREDKE